MKRLGKSLIFFLITIVVVSSVAVCGLGRKVADDGTVRGPVTIMLCGPDDGGDNPE